MGRSRRRSRVLHQKSHDRSAFSSLRLILINHPIGHKVRPSASHFARRDLSCAAVGCCALDRRTGALTPLRKLPCPGSPAQMQVDRTGHWLLTANYLGGTVSVFSLDMDGAISAIVATHTHAGASQVDQIRQRSPHAHMVTLDATNRWAIVADLGTDDVHTYSFDAESGALAPRHRVSLPPGSGPRHMCFHPSGRCESLT